jgi:hypothetical protein
VHPTCSSSRSTATGFLVTNTVGVPLGGDRVYRYAPAPVAKCRGSKSMTAQTKGRIRHVALSVEDPWETAEFYK